MHFNEKSAQSIIAKKAGEKFIVMYVNEWLGTRAAFCMRLPNVLG